MKERVERDQRSVTGAPIECVVWARTRTSDFNALIRCATDLLVKMNQFDALMTQISDLEGVNRDAERKIMAITQHSNALEADLSAGTSSFLSLPDMPPFGLKHLIFGSSSQCTSDFIPIVGIVAKATIKEREEMIAQLKETVGSLTIERDAETKNCERLKIKNQQLKESEATRGKVLDEERQVVTKLKTDLREQMEECNRRLRSALESLLGYKRTHSLPIVEENENAESDDISTDNANQTVEQDSSTAMTELAQKIISLEEKLAFAESEKTKLEENLGETLKEFKKLDDFSTNLQAQYEAIHLWYETFEEWNRSARCSSCSAALDIVPIIDRLLERATQESTTKPTDSPQSQQHQ